MTKSYDCIVCNKRATAPHRRLFKGVKYDAYRKDMSLLLRRNVTENDCICGRCHKRYSRGNLLNKNVTAETNVQVSTFYSGTKSRRYCAICGMKRKILKRIPQAARTYVFVTQSVMFYNNARACPCHFVDKSTFKNSEILKYSFRFKRSSKIITSNELKEHLTICRELLLKKQNSRIDFDDVDCLSDEDYVSLTGLSRTQFNSLVSSINGFRHRKVSGRTAFALLLTKLRT